MTDWKIFQGKREPHDAIKYLSPPPKWRRFNNQDESTINKIEIAQRWQKLQDLANENNRDKERGKNFRIQTDQHQDDNGRYHNVVDAVNAAFYLRRPLLVTGLPGSGKTSLAYAVAYELQLGPVLLWPITTRSTLQEGLYRYDAIARLQDVQLADKNKDTQPANNNLNIGEYIQLGPVGTAFLPSLYPRVLLIDEIDKSDINLPNDLLNLFEEGEFEIPEVARLSKHIGEQSVTVCTKDDNIDAPIKAGRVRCSTFPLIIMTSNGERDFPPAFLRRCLRVNMPQPEEEALKAIIKAQLDIDISEQSQDLINSFLTSLANGDNLAIDQLLNIVYLVTNDKVSRSEINLHNMQSLLLKSLSNTQDK
ncbi:MoxR family ATPase [Nostoc sp. XA010]|uniref:AAA family ATPase n=1 Tax=Nostoc sp. XA010 TaxID=2780407 RepID=UPI001E33CD16|nr:MoxR family ATPase [Nostoc sp. XA010]MCC5659176.1 MoxR family ATPase [Nostoc sp. XA010]